MFNSAFSVLASVATIIGLGGSYDNVSLEVLKEHATKLKENAFYYNLKLDKDYADNLINTVKNLSVQGKVNAREYKIIKDLLDSKIRSLIFGQDNSDNIFNLINNIEHVYFFQLEKNLLDDYSLAAWANIVCKAIEEARSSPDNKFNVAAINLILKHNIANFKDYDCDFHDRKNEDVNDISKNNYFRLNSIDLDDLSFDNLIVNKLHVLKIDDSGNLHPEYIYNCLNFLIFKTSKNGNNALKPVGLKNLGNTCFINCLLQIMANLPKLKDKLFDIEDNYTHNSVSKLFIRFLKEYNTLANNNNHNLLINKIWSLKDAGSKTIFEKGSCGDSNELFKTLLDNLTEKDMPKSTQKCTASVINNLFNANINCYILAENNPEIFWQKESLSVPNIEVSLVKDTDDGPQAITDLDIAIKDYFQTKLQQEDDGVLLEVKKITHMPEILTIALDRTYFDKDLGQSQKKHAPLTVPFELNMEQYLDVNIDVKSDYELIGVIMHHGQGNFAHYTSYVKKRNLANAVWYHCSDSAISQGLTEKELYTILSCGAGDDSAVAALFYVKKDNITNISDQDKKVDDEFNLTKFIDKNIKHSSLKSVINNELSKLDLSDIKDISVIESDILNILKNQSNLFFAKLYLDFFDNYARDKSKNGSLHFCYNQAFEDMFLISVIKLENTQPFIVVTSKSNNFNSLNINVISVIINRLHEIFIKPHQDFISKLK